MYRKKLLCRVTETNIVLPVNYTSKTNRLIEKEIIFVATREGWLGEEELDECSLKVQTSSYKINKY